jgi:haloacetate dehalogenase
MFEGFEQRRVDTERGKIFARIGGSGPAILLLHGYPQTHVMWRAVVQELAIEHTVVVVDLPGYGSSFRPLIAADHGPHSKRRIGIDLVQMMSLLGIEEFAVAGHDRGGRVAYRMALDFPERITALAVFDVVPTGEVWRRADADLMLAYWHWSFLAQPAPLPEKLIGANPSAFFDLHVRSLGLGQVSERYPPDVIETYRALLDDPTVVTAICEDYRAGAGIDRAHDDADRSAGIRIACPVLVLWSARGALPKLYRDVMSVWDPWASDVRGHQIEASHFLVEDEPEQVLQALTPRLRDVRDSPSAPS